MNDNIRIRITDDGNQKDINDIFEMLKSFNLSNREKSRNVPLGIFYEDADGKKLAGLTGGNFWQLVVHTLSFCGRAFEK